MLKSFFNPPQPKRFHHIPIYFDAEKEALEERIQKKKEELGMDEEGIHSHLEKGFIVESSTHVKRLREKKDYTSAHNPNTKLILILVLLVIVFYYFYFR